jgi:hypothetical protein
MMIVKELERMRKQAVMVPFNCYTRICFENTVKPRKLFYSPSPNRRDNPDTNFFTTAFENKW